MQGPYNVLFLCTGNSARSIMAEAVLNFKGRPNFSAYSAGSQPTGAVRPEALRQLETARIPTTGLRSKSWEEFSKPAAPKLDVVFTVCDNAAKEVCPIWPGQPLTSHWGVPDPERCAAARSMSNAHFAMLSSFSTAESVCFCAFHSKLSIRWCLNANSTINQASGSDSLCTFRFSRPRTMRHECQGEMG